jgi:hypothetical protein
LDEGGVLVNGVAVRVGWRERVRNACASLQAPAGFKPGAIPNSRTHRQLQVGTSNATKAQLQRTRSCNDFITAVRGVSSGLGRARVRSGLGAACACMCAANDQAAPRGGLTSTLALPPAVPASSWAPHPLPTSSWHRQRRHKGVQVHVYGRGGAGKVSVASSGCPIDGGAGNTNSAKRFRSGPSSKRSGHFPIARPLQHSHA